MKNSIVRILGLLLRNKHQKPRFWWRKSGKSLAEVLSDPKYR